jgi:hypothetical protein
MSTNHIQTKFTKNCDNKKVKRKALIHKLKTKGLGQCPKSFKIMCVLVLHRSTNHEHNTKDFDNKKEKQGFHLS